MATDNVPGNTSHVGVLTAASISMASSVASIEKLDGVSNYNSWKFIMRMTLKLEGLWPAVEGTETDPVRNDRALARICLAIKPNCHQFVRSASTAKDAWNNLANVFEDKGLFRRVTLLRRLHRLDFSSHATMSEYIETVMTLVQQLSDIGKTIEDAEVAEILLSGLPQEYDALVSNLETANLTSSLSSELVRARLLQEEFRKTSTPETTNAAFISQRKEKAKIICHYCKKPGHIKSRCFKLKHDKKRENSDKTCLATAFLVKSDKDFYIDSGSSAHMCNDKSLFDSFTSCKDTDNSITVANNDKLKCMGVGNITINTNNSVRKLENVLYVPQLVANLISVSRLTQKGFTLTFDSKGCFIFDQYSKEPIATASYINGMYKLNGSVCMLVGSSQNSNCESMTHNGVSTLKPLHERQGTQSAADAVYPRSVDLWHRRLGHMGSSGMCALRELATGVGFNNDTLQECVSCLEGKLTARPFPKGEAQRASKPLELVHTDVCGPMQECSLGGARYLVTYTDDYTRKTFGYLIKKKSEVMSTFIHFKALVEKQLGLFIKVLRSDGGGEYCNDAFSAFMKKEGIVHQTTVPYCSQQNGVAERLNRTLMDKARCMMQGAGLDKRYWGEAVMTAIYLKNRSPTSALSGHTPEGLWTGSKPDLSHLRVFGCIAYSLVPEQRRRKLDARSKMYIFVGYSETSKGYRLADPSDPRKIVLSRNVVFMENKFYTDNANNNYKDFLFYDEMTFNNENNINLNNETININYDDSDMNEINDDPMIISDDADNDEYCTGSEHEASSAESPASGSPGEAVTSPREAPARGEVVPEVPVSSTGRPLRSTRRPPRYNDYVTMIAQGSCFDEPESYEEAISCSNGDDWKTAMQSEYDSLISNKVWKLVDRPLHENVVKCKWVFKTKHDASGRFEKYKARLVARGFTQVHGVDYSDTFSPVVRHSTMRILFSLANELDYDISHIDVATAFLNGELSETIYMEQPPGFDNGDKSKVCLLLKGIYGLKQASRIWNSKVHDLLTSEGYTQSKCEPCVYIKKSNKDVCMIALYVDDFYVFSSRDSSNKKELFNLLDKNFNVKDLGSLKSCLGINVSRNRSKGILKLDQSEYIKRLLVRFGMEQCKTVSTPMPVNCKLNHSENDVLCDEQYHYRQLLGCLMYLSVCTRPDISFACSQLSQFNNSFGKSHWLAAKRILRYLAGTIDYGLYYIKCNELKMSAFTDADWGNDCTDRKSYTGFVIKLGNNTVSWESRKQRCVALSSTEAEYLAISDVSKDICFIKNFLSEILCKELDIVIYNDNQSAHKLLELKEYCHKRTKHIDIRYHFVKDLISKKVINVEYLSTEKMIADIFTKPLSSVKHVEFTKCMNVK